MKTATFTLWSLLFLLPLSAQSQTDFFSGKFTNTEVGLEISLQNNGGQYAGQFTVQGQSFPLTAQLMNGNTLSGTYPYNGLSVPIQIQMAGQSYTLVTEGMQLAVTRQAAAPRGALGSLQKDPGPSMPTTPGSGSSNSTSTSSNMGTKATGQRVEVAASGYVFNAPQDWVHRQLEDGSILIGHNTKAGFILVSPHEYNDLQTIATLAQQEGIAEENIQLQLSSQVQQYGNNGLIADFAGNIEGQSAKVKAISLLSPHGGGVTIMVGVLANLFTEEYVELAKSIANSVQFRKPVESPLVDQYRQRLTGKKLVYYKTNTGSTGGSSDKRKYLLYDNGQFQYQSNSSYNSLGGFSDFSAAGQGSDSGTWKIKGRGQQAVLVLSYNDGSTGELVITPRDSSGQINLNGERFFITDMNSDY